MAITVNTTDTFEQWRVKTNQLGSDVDSNIAAVRSDITSNVATINTNIAGNVSAVRSDISSNVLTINTNIAGNVATINTNIAGNVSAVRSDIASNVLTINTNIAGNVSAVRSDIASNVLTINTNIAGNVSAVRSDIASNVLTINTNIAGNVNSILANVSLGTGNVSTGNLRVVSNAIISSNLTVLSNVLLKDNLLISSGNIGIGTASPTVKLDVNGAAKTNTPVTATNDTTVATTAYVVNRIANDTIGIGQTWQSVTRSISTWYQNTTGLPIMVAVTFEGRNGKVYSGVSTVSYTQITGTISNVPAQDTNSRPVHSFIVPPNWYYYIFDATIINVKELR